jgi:branched-chain amino acid transport system substrate-binding protein
MDKSSAHHTRHGLVCSLVLFSLVLVVCRVGRASNIVIGMSAAFTGPSGHLGTQLYRGITAYIEYINRHGGVNGNQIIIKAYDDGYNPVPAIKNTIRLIEKDNVFLLFSYVGTPTVTRVLPLLKSYVDRFIYLFFPFTGAQPQREPPYDQFVFNLRASYRQETEGLVEHFVAIGRKRLGVFYQADAYGRSGWDGVRRALAKHGLRMVGEATYRRGTDYAQSLRRQVEILRQARPDAIISIGAYAACAAFIRDARDAGWEVPIANVSFVGSESMLGLLRESRKATGRSYTANLINSQVVPSYTDTSLPAVREYRELLGRYASLPPGTPVQARAETLRYSFVSFEGYLNAKLLVEILRRMRRTPEQARLKEVVEGITDYDLGIKTPVSFTRHKHQGLNTVYYTMIEGDQFVPLTDWQRWKK